MHILYIERANPDELFCIDANPDLKLVNMQTQMSYSLLMQIQMNYPLNSAVHLFSLPAVDSLKDFPHCTPKQSTIC